jgi:uncharacterized protein YgbK (DUF1537 family)
VTDPALELLVLADDRTGALEAAGACADAGFSVVMAPVGCSGALAPHDCLVVDLGSRHVDAVAARGRVGMAEVPAKRHAHKIDSTLKGNWAAELAARSRRTLLIPAFPAAGRTCHNGIVHVHGAPIGRPADQLESAGATQVVVADASTDEEVATLVDTWRDDPELLLAGTAGVIGAGARAIVRARSLGTHAAVTPRATGPVLIVCGSRQPVARAQAAALGGRHDVVVPGDGAGRGTAVLQDLHDRVASRLDDVGVLVLIGGDTSAVVLGGRPMVVGGTLEPGVAWSRFADGSGPLVVTKPGGFGDARTLVRVLDVILAGDADE